MNLQEEYRLYTYHDYGPLLQKENIRLVRNEISGQICVKKILDADKEKIYDFLKRNSNPFLPEIEECIIENDRLIVIEEYINGRTLENLISEKKFTEEETVKIAMDICKGLAPLHKNHIICRDLKSENVMISKEGNVKIIDFDIARLYQNGKNQDTRILGTVGYAAPEQFGFLQTDGRVDIYALGVLMNVMMTGEIPQKKLIPGKLRSVVEKCIELNPDDRYQTVEELFEVLKSKTDNNSYIYQKEEIKYKKENLIHKYMIPGFRTKTWWKMIFSIVVYILLFSFTLTIQFYDADGSLYPQNITWLNRIMILLSGLIEIGLVFDYRNIQKKIPILYGQKQWIKIMIYILTGIVLCVGALLLASIIETLFL